MVNCLSLKGFMDTTELSELYPNDGASHAVTFGYIL